MLDQSAQPPNDPSPMRVEESTAHDLAKSSFSPQHRSDLLLTNPEQYVRAELKQFLGNRPRVPSRQHLHREDIQIKHLYEVLRHCSAEERVGLLSEIMTATAASKKMPRFVECNTPLMLYFTAHAEKAALLTQLLEYPKGKAVIQLCLETMRSCRTLKDLNALVKEVGQEKLLEIRNSDLRELVAQGILGLELRKAGLPAHISKYSGKRSIPIKLTELKHALEERIEICKQDPELARTEFAKESIRTARYNIAYIQEERQRSRTVGGLKEMTNMLIDKTRLEFTYGLILTNERDEANKIHRRWTQDDIKEVKSILARIPEGPLLWTPYLREICRVEKLGPTDFAERDGEGIIRIADAAIEYEEEFDKYKPYSWLAATFCHELGHSFHFGTHYGFAKVDKADQGLKEPFDPRYDYQDYLAITGWKAQRTGFKISDDRQRVQIDGEWYPLGLPVTIDGESRFFVHDREEKILFSHPANAEFSPGSYAKTNPWEDWAEAFAEYIVKPSRLISFAPKKFAFFEQEFRRYDNNEAIKKQLYKRLFPEEAILKHLSQLSAEQQERVLKGLSQLVENNRQ